MNHEEERRLMLALTGSARRRAVEPFGGEPDWSVVYALAAKNDLTPLLWYGAQKAGLEGNVPALWRDKFREAYDLSLARNVYLLKRLDRVLRCLAEERVEVVLLKGAALLEDLYPDIGSRPMEDVDLLVREEVLDRVHALMGEMGYARTEEKEDCNTFVERSCGPAPFRAVLEFHATLHVPLRLDRSLAMDTGAAWRDAERCGSVQALSPLDRLLYLSGHLANHNYEKLKWVVDIARHVEKHGEEIDWTLLPGRCGRIGARTPVWFSLSLARSLFGAPVPYPCLSALSPSAWKRNLLYRLVENMHSGNRVLSTRQASLLRFLLVDRVHEALRWSLFPSKDWLAARYGVKRRWAMPICRGLHVFVFPLQVFSRLCGLRGGEYRLSLAKRQKQ